MQKITKLTYNSAFASRTPVETDRQPKPCSSGINGDNESDYKRFRGCRPHRIDGTNEIQGADKRYEFKSEHLTDAVRFLGRKTPITINGYLFALQDGRWSPIVFTSKRKQPTQPLRPLLNNPLRGQTADQKMKGLKGQLIEQII